ncbi:molecular chaperone DnaJ [Aphanothece hegewaldii CCALA 016]|uniref:Molecular chaperone DnaJ n=1 Tax=Aphanothece hegewaldii CCALA 016 TaxID=2107694 RepID=A0A2T1LQG5_9CHRO|nr:molecular chaperone DnaJ [Aphanothece hegewaldii]PSF27852.1 molecular chaperone DnaJ [Aphanothece hegewaldii CCALA 016]
MLDRSPCYHCKGKGFIEIRDCSGEIQREETCVFCSGTGVSKEQNDED